MSSCLNPLNPTPIKIPSQICFCAHAAPRQEDRERVREVGREGKRAEKGDS